MAFCRLRFYSKYLGFAYMYLRFTTRDSLSDSFPCISTYVTGVNGLNTLKNAQALRAFTSTFSVDGLAIFIKLFIYLETVVPFTFTITSPLFMCGCMLWTTTTYLLLYVHRKPAYRSWLSLSPDILI